MEDAAPFLRRIHGAWYPGLLGAFAVALVGLAVLWPAFHASFTWPYLWGPVVADAAGFAPSETYMAGPSPTHAGYNAVNTAAWAVVFGLAALAAWRLLLRLGLRLEGALLAGAALWSASGCVLHVVEDAGALRPPLQYALITPLIYFAVGLPAIAALVLGHRWRAGNGPAVMAWSGAVVLAASAAWLAAVAWSQPVQPAAGAALALAVAYVLLLWGLAARSRDRAFLVTPLVGVIAFFGALDAFTTMVAVDLLGYGEKHVVPRLLIRGAGAAGDGLGWAWMAQHAALAGFVPVKLAATGGAAYALARAHGLRAAQPTLHGLLMFALLLDGLGPGLRGFLRLGLGV